MIEKCPRRRSGLTYEELVAENELMLVDEDAGKVQVLNATAGGLWLLCDGERSVDDLTDLLCKLFPGLPRDEVLGRVEDTVRFLRNEGLLE